jgi:hypothetical protein
VSLLEIWVLAWLPIIRPTFKNSPKAKDLFASGSVPKKKNSFITFTSGGHFRVAAGNSSRSSTSFRQEVVPEKKCFGRIQGLAFVNFKFRLLSFNEKESPLN